MKQINRELGTTFIFSTHDQRVMTMADRLVEIEDGEVMHDGVSGRTATTKNPLPPVMAASRATAAAGRP
jgi:putative ABC transport system ATP-binding protein